MTKKQNRLQMLVDIVKKEFRVAPEAFVARDNLLKMVEAAYKAELARRRDWGGRIG